MTVVKLPPTSPVIEIRGVSHEFEARGRRLTALMDIGMDVQPGELVSLVGPSGCGKSTLIRILAGLLPPSAGEVRVDGSLVKGPPPDVLILFQQYEKSLLPWRTVRGNLQFAMENMHLGREERDRRIADALGSVGLEEFGHHYPGQLSGGMQQRVAIARALVRRPRVLLMDEPFSSLDAMTRADLQDLTLRLWRERSQTILFVTHDVDEAVYLSGRVLVLAARPGRIRRQVEIPLPYPRSQTQTREDPVFLRARRAILEAIYNEQSQGNDERAASLFP